jgi:hypothetical protein
VIRKDYSHNLSREINIFFVRIYYVYVCCIKFEAHYLHRATKLIRADPAQYVALLYGFELYYYDITKLAANTYSSGSY